MSKIRWNVICDDVTLLVIDDVSAMPEPAELFYIDNKMYRVIQREWNVEEVIANNDTYFDRVVVNIKIMLFGNKE